MDQNNETTIVYITKNASLIPKQHDSIFETNHWLLYKVNMFDIRASRLFIALHYKLDMFQK